MARYSLKVNGKTRSVDADADTPLLYVLRDNLELRGPKFGCGLGQCGARSVPFTPAKVKAALAAAPRRA